MKILHLAFQEIRYRKTSFFLALLATIFAVAHTVNAVMLIQVQRTETEKSTAELNDAMRKITKGLGFNINILPAELNLQSFYAEDFADKTMPGEFVHKIAQSKVVKSIRHLRPALIQKLQWQEKNRSVIMMGVQGVIPFAHLKNPKKPMTEAVPKDSMNIGNVLANDLHLKVGDETIFNGETFRINKVYPARGSKDDITVWIDLQRAQEMVDLPDRINLIQALECNCATLDRLEEIKGEIQQVLGGDVHVIELATPALARAKARNEVSADGIADLQRMQKNSVLQITILTIVVAVVLAILSWLNVRERKSEIGVLRAVGASTQKLLGLFLSRAILIGVTGAILGCLLGVASAKMMVEAELTMQPLLFTAMVVITPIITAIACWIPVTMAATQDAAGILSEE